MISAKWGRSPAELEHEVDLAPERSRDDGELKAIQRRVLDEIGNAWHQAHRGANGSLVLRMLAGDGLAERGVVLRSSHALEGESEALAIVEAEILAVIRVPVQRVPVSGQRGDQRIAML